MLAPRARLRLLRSASTPDGRMSAIAVCSLFSQPVTTSPSPFSIASKPSVATWARSSFLLEPILVSVMSARAKKSVSVAPGNEAGHRDVVVLQFVAQREGEGVEERLARVIDRLVGARDEAGDRPGDEDAAPVTVAHVGPHLLNDIERVDHPSPGLRILVEKGVAEAAAGVGARSSPCVAAARGNWPVRRRARYGRAKRH